MLKLYITTRENKEYLIKKLAGNGKYFSCVKSYNEVLEDFYGTYDEKAVYYVVKNYNVTREIALVYLENIRYVDKYLDNEKINFLVKLKDELLENKLLKINNQIKDYYVNYEVVFYHIPLKDKMFTNLVEEILKITKVSIEDYSLGDCVINLNASKKIDDEVINVCANICKDILDGVSCKNIYVANLNQEYKNALSFYGKLFNLKFNFKSKINVYATKIINYFCENINSNWTELLEDIKVMVKTSLEQKVYDALVSFCNKYVSYPKDKVTTKFLLETIKDLEIKSDYIENAINEIDFLQTDADYDSHIYILGVNEGSFPLIYKDLNYLTDKELKMLFLSTTSEKNKITYEFLKCKLTNYSNLYLSYSKVIGGMEMYPASILKELKTVDARVVEPLIYSKKYAYFKYALEMDLYNKYGVVSKELENTYPLYKDSDYRSFDSSFKNFSLKEIPNKTLSYTSLDVYNRCSFRYYLAYILKLQKYNNDDFMILIGNLYHKVLENLYKDNFSFEVIYNEFISECKNLGNKEKFFLSKFKTSLKEITHVIKHQEEYSNLKNVLCEKEFIVPLKNEFFLKGIIDKLYYANNLVSVVDYKTGTPKIDLNMVNYGIGMQLPIYVYLLKNSEFKDFDVAGFYLQKLIPNLIVGDFKHTKEELANKTYMLSGYSNSEYKKISEFDSSFNDSHVVSGLKVSSKGFYSYSKVISDEEILDMTSEVEKQINSVCDGISASKYEINPKRIDKELVGCMYCPYQEICFRKEKDIVNLEYKKATFLGGEDNGVD